jgi:L-asparaginase II
MSEAVQDNPILVEVTRGGLVESCHRGAVAIADADGRVLLGLGDIERPVYPRSAVKALQAIPLIESGAADAFGLRQAELAIACASHSGDETHIGAVRMLLAKAGLD